jgi:hypothetical protein
LTSKRNNQPSKKGLKGPPAKKAASKAEQNALHGLVKNPPPMRDINPAAAYSTSARGRDFDPSRKRVMPRRG